jgi:hypothetical protein
MCPLLSVTMIPRAPAKCNTQHAPGCADSAIRGAGLEVVGDLMGLPESRLTANRASRNSATVTEQRHKGART